MKVVYTLPPFRPFHNSVPPRVKRATTIQIILDCVSVSEERTSSLPRSLC